MSTFRPTVLAAVLAFGFVSVSLAQAKSKPAEKAKEGAKPAASSGMAMKPAPEMEKIKWMAGTWHCAGKTMASPMGPEHPVEAEVKAEMALDGMWMRAQYREKKTAQNPHPMSADDYWTYDPAEKMWDRVAVDNMGGFMTGSAKGWDQGKLVWDMDAMMGGQKMKFRDAFVQKSPTELTNSGEAGTPDGKWAPAWDTSCKK
jgi:hypothetical protein